jgi:DNA-binding response OmpR family regulator
VRGRVLKVLFVDDDQDILDITAYALRRQGFAVSMATNGSQALEAWQTTSPDIVLLDVRMPRMNGFEVLRTIRMQSETPIIMVTARAEEEDILLGLGMGADDYVTKPFSPIQLGARIRSVARRVRAVARKEPENLQVATISLDVESHEARCGDTTTRMTPLEFRILRTLMLEAGRVVPSSRLIDRTWGFEGGDARMLKTHVSQVRKKLGVNPGQAGYIKNYPGVGYVLETDVFQAAR